MTRSWVILAAVRTYLRVVCVGQGSSRSIKGVAVPVGVRHVWGGLSRRSSQDSQLISMSTAPVATSTNSRSATFHLQVFVVLEVKLYVFVVFDFRKIKHILLTLLQKLKAFLTSL